MLKTRGAAAFGIGRFFFGAVPDGFIGLFPLLTFCAAQLQNIADMMTCYENNMYIERERENDISNIYMYDRIVICIVVS